MKITKSDIRQLIKESFERNFQAITLTNKITEIKNQLFQLNEEEYQSNYVVPDVNQIPEEKEALQKPESIFDYKVGETVILNFEGVTIKIQRQFDDLFKVVDGAESKKLKEGDYVKFEGNDILEVGKTFKLIIYRATDLKYETNPLESWKKL